MPLGRGRLKIWKALSMESFAWLKNWSIFEDTEFLNEKEREIRTSGSPSYSLGWTVTSRSQKPPQTGRSFQNNNHVLRNVLVGERGQDTAAKMDRAF
jgi:hypothetical protein